VVLNQVCGPVNFQNKFCGPVDFQNQPKMQLRQNYAIQKKYENQFNEKFAAVCLILYVLNAVLMKFLQGEVER